MGETFVVKRPNGVRFTQQEWERALTQSRARELEQKIDGFIREQSAKRRHRMQREWLAALNQDMGNPLRKEKGMEIGLNFTQSNPQ